MFPRANSITEQELNKMFKTGSWKDLAKKINLKFKKSVEFFAIAKFDLKATNVFFYEGHHERLENPSKLDKR
jgi:hypothetical protein